MLLATNQNLCFLYGLEVKLDLVSFSLSLMHVKALMCAKYDKKQSRFNI